MKTVFLILIILLFVGLLIVFFFKKKPKVTTTTTTKLVPVTTTTTTINVNPKFVINYSVSGPLGGGLEIIGNSSKILLKLTTNGKYQVGKIETNDYPYTVIGTWASAELFYTSNPINNMNSNVKYIVDPTPDELNVHFVSGVDIEPMICIAE